MEGRDVQAEKAGVCSDAGGILRPRGQTRSRMGELEEELQQWGPWSCEPTRVWFLVMTCKHKAYNDPQNHHEKARATHLPLVYILWIKIKNKLYNVQCMLQEQSNRQLDSLVYLVHGSGSDHGLYHGLWIGSLKPAPRQAKK